VRSESLLTLAALVAGLPAWGPPAAAAESNRGAHFTIAGTGSKLTAPQQSETTDLDLFNGVGIDVAGGYRFGWFRFEGELHFNRSERAFTGDRITVRNLMLNGYGDFPVSKQLTIFVGAGLGDATVDVGIETCLDLEGCATFATVDASERARAYQYMVGLGWSATGKTQFFLSYRRLRTEELGLRDAAGGGFADDRFESQLLMIGITWRFNQRTARSRQP